MTEGAGAAMNRRVLVVDDNEAIHADFRKILQPATTSADALLAAEADLFGEAPSRIERVAFDLVCASQGQEALAIVDAASAAGRPFAMAFVDMRMPPGWDGLETIERIWAKHPEVEMVICTAFSDYSWEETIRRLGRTDRLLIVKKPFDQVEVLQVASALTHKWNLQQQARRVLGDLGEMVRGRTADLERARDELVAVNDQLVRARDAAEAANRSKTIFLANVSHELRTPMTAILGYAEELHDRMTGHEAWRNECEALETIRRNALHMVAVVGDLLDISKLEAGKLTVERLRCAPLHMVSDVVELIRPKAVQKGLRIDAEYDGPVPVTICTDPLRFRQILLNLVDNAVKFTTAGRVLVRIGLEEGADPVLWVDVLDTGDGMAEDVLQRLFRPFEQADASTTRRFGGTGLGLAISRHLAQLLGGGIEVSSVPGVGSRFRVTVATGPLDGVARIDSPARLGASPGVGKATTVNSAAVDARVLLVEDGLDNQRLVASILRRVGCEVAVADNGRQCLDRIAAGEVYDVVLMDLQMPVMDGITATRRLRESGYEGPIVALTANAMQGDREQCLTAGCDAYLSKPIDRGRLCDTVAALARGQDAPGPAGCVDPA